MAILAAAAVKEHLAQPPVGHSILGAAGELVEHLLVVKHKHTEVVIFLMQFGDTSRLVKVGARRQDNHVGDWLTMDILVRNLTQEFGMGENSRLVKGDEFLAAAILGAESDSAITGFNLHLHDGKRIGDIPHTGCATASAHAITVAGIGILQTEGKITVAQRQMALIVDGQEVQTGQFYRAVAGILQRVVQFIGAVHRERLDRSVTQTIQIVMDMGNSIDSTDDVGIGHRQRIAVITLGDGAGHIRCPSAEHQV